LRSGSAASSARSELGFTARFAVGSLATWRLTHLLAEEDGPGDMVVRVRAALGDGPAGELMDCFYCLSVWVAAPMSLAVARRGRDVPLTWLGLSGAACLLERFFTVPGTVKNTPEKIAPSRVFTVPGTVKKWAAGRPEAAVSEEAL
jgi:hypothetical protein